MKSRKQEIFKTTVILERELLEDMDRHNPFTTRKAFISEACRSYIEEMKKKEIDRQLEIACAEAASEDMEANDEWEAVTLEEWK